MLFWHLFGVKVSEKQKGKQINKQKPTFPIKSSLLFVFPFLFLSLFSFILSVSFSRFLSFFLFLSLSLYISLSVSLSGRKNHQNHQNNRKSPKNPKSPKSAIDPYQFLGKVIWTNHWSIPFLGEIRMDQWS